MYADVNICFDASENKETGWLSGLAALTKIKTISPMQAPKGMGARRVLEALPGDTTAANTEAGRRARHPRVATPHRPEAIPSRSVVNPHPLVAALCRSRVTRHLSVAVLRRIRTIRHLSVAILHPYRTIRHRLLLSHLGLALSCLHRQARIRA